jgi:hypothetical protein
MMFTHFGRIVAFLALLLGIYYVAGGLMIVAGWLEPKEAALATFFPGKSTTGAVIDRGTYYIGLAIALGILTEISFSVRANRQV